MGVRPTAAWFLDGRERTFEEVALKLGFSELSGLRSFYRRRAGLPPIAARSLGGFRYLVEFFEREWRAARESKPRRG